MRKTAVALVLIGLIWIGYVAWPLYELTVLVRAIDARNMNTVARHVNFDRMRVSLTEHIVSAFMKKSGIQLNLLSQQAVVAVTVPITTKLVSPEALSELMVVGWPAGVVPNAPPSGSLGITSNTLGTAWQMFAASHYGMGRFEVWAPRVLPPENQFRLRFQLLAWRWQLVGITLPENILDLLVQEVNKALRERR